MSTSAFRVNNETSSTSAEDTSEGDNSKNGKEKTQFSNSCSVIVSLLGFSMGTADFWRFPYLVFRNGGGAFLIPFTLTMVVCGLPMFFLEISMSQFSGKGSLLLWDFAPFFKGIGFVLLFINVLNSVYYNILRSWMLEYMYLGFQYQTVPWQGCNHAWNREGCVEIAPHVAKETSHLYGNVSSNVTSMLTGLIANVSGNGTSVVTMTAAEQFWQFKVLNLSPGIDNLGGIIWRFVFFAFIWRTLVTLCMVKSIKSIEKVMFVTVFVPIALMIAIWIRALTLEGAVQGMLYYITPTFDRIADPKVWLEAALMAVYTLGPGWGTIPLIGSHNKFRSNCYRHSVITTACDCMSAVLNGLICFSILGVMAHDAELELEKTVTSGLSLGFTVYPTALTFFPLPQLWTTIFFINLLLVGLDSTVLSLETVMNCLQDLWPTMFKGRRRLFMLVAFNILSFLLSIPLCTQGGMYIFQLLDWYAVAWSLLFITFMECIAFMWIYGGDKINRDMEIMLGRPLPALLRVTASFCTPVILLILLIISFIRYQAPTYGFYNYPVHAEVMGWLIALFVVSPVFVVFVFNLMKSPGSLSQRLKRITVPSFTWGPNDEVCAEEYREEHWQQKGLCSLAIFNLTGRNRNVKGHYNVAENVGGINDQMLISEKNYCV